MPAESLLPRPRVRGPAGPDCGERTELGRSTGELWPCATVEGAGGGVAREQALGRGAWAEDSICTGGLGGVDDRELEVLSGGILGSRRRELGAESDRDKVCE